jgi:hypothetical protein
MNLLVSLLDRTLIQYDTETIFAFSMDTSTDTTVVHLIQIWILVSEDTAQVIFVSYYKNMVSNEDTNNMLHVTKPDQIQICGSKLILQSFA